MGNIGDLERRLIVAAAVGDITEHARVRGEIRAAGFPQLASELDRIANGPVGESQRGDAAVGGAG